MIQVRGEGEDRTGETEKGKETATGTEKGIVRGIAREIVKGTENGNEKIVIVDETEIDEEMVKTIAVTVVAMVDVEKLRMFVVLLVAKLGMLLLNVWIESALGGMTTKMTAKFISNHLVSEKYQNGERIAAARMATGMSKKMITDHLRDEIDETVVANAEAAEATAIEQTNVITPCLRT